MNALTLDCTGVETHSKMTPRRHAVAAVECAVESAVECTDDIPLHILTLILPTVLRQITEFIYEMK